MKFRIQVQQEGEPTPMAWEEYNRPAITTLDQAEIWAQELVEYFNKTRRGPVPARRLVNVEYYPQSKAAAPHDWRFGAFNRIDKDGFSYKTCECAVCGLTGRAYGRVIEHDRPFRAIKYACCEVTQKAQQEKQNKAR